MGKIFCVQFQRAPLKFNTKYVTHKLKDMIYIHFWKIERRYLCDMQEMAHEHERKECRQKEFAISYWKKNILTKIFNDANFIVTGSQHQSLP